jgi:hypothetical protein
MAPSGWRTQVQNLIVRRQLARFIVVDLLAHLTTFPRFPPILPEIPSPPRFCTGFRQRNLQQ